MGQDDQFVCLILAKHPARRKLGSFPVHFARCIRVASMDALVAPQGLTWLLDKSRHHKRNQLKGRDY